MIDADGSTDGHEISTFVDALVPGADFAKGSRFANGGGTDDMTLDPQARQLGADARIVNRMFGTRYTDLCYGYNAFWARCLDELDLDCDGFEVETLMNIRVAKARAAGCRRSRATRPAGSTARATCSAVRDGLRVLKMILREWRTARRPPPPQPAASAPAADRGVLNEATSPW